MKFGFLAAAAAIALSTQPASAQFIYPPSAGRGTTIGSNYSTPGGLFGGIYSWAPRYYAQPLYAGPVIIPVRPVAPVYLPPIYSRPYYAAPYHHHRHGYRW